MTDFITYRNGLEKVCAEKKEKDAMHILNRQGSMCKITFECVYDTVRSYSAVMDKYGLIPGDRVILLSDHIPSLIQMFLCVSYWNLTAVMLDASLPTTTLCKTICEMDARVIFTSQNMIEKIPGNIRKIVPLLDITKPEQQFPTLDSSMQGINAAPTPDPNPDIAVIILSSGTTGEIKAVEISYHAILTEMRQSFKLCKVRDKDRLLMLLPLFHISGLYATLNSIFNGNTVLTVDEFTPAELPKLIQIFQPEYFIMIPKVFDLMVQKFQQEIAKKGRLIRWYYRVAGSISYFLTRHFPSVSIGRFIMRPFSRVLFGKNIHTLQSGASVCNPETPKVLTRLGLQWCYIYASTECGVPITAITKKDRFPFNSVGKVNSVDGVDIILLHPDITGIGEICVKTEQIMNGYFRDSELTLASFYNGYFKTGDLGYIDREGYLYVCGRVKESIHLPTGKKVAPADIEHVLNMAGLNCEAAVCGVPSVADGFDKIHIFICDQRYSTAEKENFEKQIRDIFNKELPHLLPEQFHFVSELPKNAVGKVKRYLLSESVRGQQTEETALTKTTINSYCLYSKDQLVDMVGELFFPEECGVSNITGDTLLRESPGLDSLKFFQIMLKIEEYTGVSIGTDITSLFTIDDAASYIYDRQNIHASGFSEDNK